MMVLLEIVTVAQRREPNSKVGGLVRFEVGISVGADAVSSLPEMDAEDIFRQVNVFREIDFHILGLARV